MGRKRRSDNDEDGFEVAESGVNEGAVNKIYESDDSLHLPFSIFGSAENGSSKKKKKDKRLSKASHVTESASPSIHFTLKQEDHSEASDAALTMDQEGGSGSVLTMEHEHFGEAALPMERESHSEPPVKKIKMTSGPRFAVYLIRKPIELSTEELSSANIPVDSCSSREKKIVINDKAFTIRGSKPPVQMFHIPAEVIHSSEKSRFKGIDSPIYGTITIGRAEFDKSADLQNGGSDLLLESTTDLPFKVIKKKVSRKGIQNLRQRLKANGVKYTEESSSANEAIDV